MPELTDNQWPNRENVQWVSLTYTYTVLQAKMRSVRRQENNHCRPLIILLQAILIWTKTRLHVLYAANSERREGICLLHDEEVAITRKVPTEYCS